VSGSAGTILGVVPGVPGVCSAATGEAGLSASDGGLDCRRAGSGCSTARARSFTATCTGLSAPSSIRRWERRSAIPRNLPGRCRTSSLCRSHSLQPTRSHWPVWPGSVYSRCPRAVTRPSLGFPS